MCWGTWLSGGGLAVAVEVQEGGGEERRAEGEEVEGDEEDFVHEAEDEEDSLEFLLASCAPYFELPEFKTYLVRVIKVQDVRTALIHLLMALSLPTHNKRRIHMHIMTRQIQRNQTLENNRPAWESGCEEDE